MSALDVTPIDRARRPKARPYQEWEHALFAALLKSKTVDKTTGDETYRILPSSANVAAIMQRHAEWAGVVAFDEFAGRIVTTSPPPWHELDAPAELAAGPWTDADTARAVHWFARNQVLGLSPISVTAKVVDAAVIVAAEANKVHPVRGYLRALRWDGEPRLETFAARYLGATDTAYHRAVAACFLVGAVARVMRPGCKLDTCTVLEGDQGTGKSTALAILGGEWFADSRIAIGEKDGLQALRGVWIAELGELAALRKADVETTKAYLSSRVDRYRPSYGRHEIEVPRQTVFAATTNAASYLHDETGARRFPAIRTGRIALGALARDRDQIWAEAVRRFDEGAPWWLSGELAETAAEEAEARFVRHPWEASCAAYLAAPRRAVEGVTTEDLLAHVGVEPGRRTRADAMTVGAILGRLGWARRRQRMPDGSRTYRYHPTGAR